MVTVLGVSTALPTYHADNNDVLRVGRAWLKDSTDKLALFERFLSSSHTANRYFVMPPDEIIKQSSLERRSAMFEKHAPELALVALKEALKRASLKPTDIDGLLFMSCSCPLIPSPDTYLVDALQMRRDIVRVPSYQCGCAGGVIGLGLAHRLSAGLKNIALVSAELCSLVFQPTDTSHSSLVGAALFGDGASAAIISNSATSGLQIVDHQSELIPQSRHLMGYDNRDTGAHLRLDKELPSALAEQFPGPVKRFLAKHSLSQEQISSWLFHPGSAKIVNKLQELLELRPEQAVWAHEVLRSVGNLSSSTILFVLERFLQSDRARPGESVVIAGIGPGLTIELVLARID